MKKPVSLIYTDGVCVYISVNVSNPVIGKVALILADLMLLCPVIIGITEGILALILLSGVFFLFLLKYTLWNFWGQENIIISTKSVSYQQNYGLFKTGYTTKTIFNRLVIDYLDDGNEPGCVNCRFITYGETNHIPFEIYQMIFPINLKDARKIGELLDKLFIDQLSDGFGMPHISLN